jgi:adenylate cyclase
MQFGEFELDSEKQLLRQGGLEVRAEPKVLAVIDYLARNRDRVVPKQELLEELWEETFVSESALTRVIRDARKILGDSSSEPRFIRTIYGKGFLFVAPVDAGRESSRTAENGRPSIAVLPFEDLSADGSQAFFCEGLADEIINALTRIETLDVISRKSSFEAGRREEDPRAAGKLLGVTSVLEGSVRRSGDRVRVAVHLVDVASGRARWSDRYDGSVEDVFAIQETIAEKTVTALLGVIGEVEKRVLHDRPHPGVRAWEYYLKGRQLYYQDTPRTHEAARQMYARALEIEPEFALGWAGLATVIADAYLAFRRREGERAEADRASLRALELDDSLPDVHTSRALALVVAGRDEEAVTEFEAAIALDPRSFDAHYNFARHLWTIGRRGQAILHAERAASVRPDDYMSTIFLIQAYYGVGRESERLNAALRTIELTRRRLEIRPDDVRALCFNAEAHWIVGEKDKAMRRIDDAYRIDPHDVCTLYNSACVFALDGQTERALTAIEDAVRGGYSHREWLQNDPDLAVLLDHPRFRNLIESLTPIK